MYDEHNYNDRELSSKKRNPFLQSNLCRTTVELQNHSKMQEEHLDHLMSSAESVQVVHSSVQDPENIHEWYKTCFNAKDTFSA